MNEVIRVIKALSPDQLHMIMHASGLDRSRIVFRRTYNTHPTDHNMIILVKQNCFKEGSASEILGDSKMYYLTELGEKVAHTVKKATTIKLKTVRRGR